MIEVFRRDHNDFVLVPPHNVTAASQSSLGLSLPYRSGPPWSDLPHAVDSLRLVAPDTGTNATLGFDESRIQYFANGFTVLANRYVSDDSLTQNSVSVEPSSFICCHFRSPGERFIQLPEFTGFAEEPMLHPDGTVTVVLQYGDDPHDKRLYRADAGSVTLEPWGCDEGNRFRKVFYTNGAIVLERFVLGKGAELAIAPSASREFQSCVSTVLSPLKAPLVHPCGGWSIEVSTDRAPKLFCYKPKSERVIEWGDPSWNNFTDLYHRREGSILIAVIQEWSAHDPSKSRQVKSLMYAPELGAQFVRWCLPDDREPLGIKFLPDGSFVVTTSESVPGRPQLLRANLPSESAKVQPTQAAFREWGPRDGAVTLLDVSVDKEDRVGAVFSIDGNPRLFFALSLDGEFVPWSPTQYPDLWTLGARIDLHSLDGGRCLVSYGDCRRGNAVHYDATNFGGELRLIDSDAHSLEDFVQIDEEIALGYGKYRGLLFDEDDTPILDRRLQLFDFNSGTCTELQRNYRAPSAPALWSRVCRNGCILFAGKDGIFGLLKGNLVQIGRHISSDRTSAFAEFGLLLGADVARPSGQRNSPVACIMHGEIYVFEFAGCRVVRALPALDGLTLSLLVFCYESGSLHCVRFDLPPPQDR